MKIQPPTTEFTVILESLAKATRIAHSIGTDDRMTTLFRHRSFFARVALLAAFGQGMGSLTAAYACGRINPRDSTSAPYAGDSKGRVLYLNGHAECLDVATCKQIN
jgi:hypothetical protein